MEAKDTVMNTEQRTLYEEKCQRLVHAYHQENPNFDQKLVERSLDDKAIQICQDVALEELEAQAEISFKMGYETGLKEQGSPRADAEIRLADEEFAKKYRKAWNEDSRTIKPYKAGRKAGIKEVIEWIDVHKWHLASPLGIEEWKAKVKEWEVK